MNNQLATLNNNYSANIESLQLLAVQKDDFELQLRRTQLYRQSSTREFQFKIESLRKVPSCGGNFN